MTPEIPPLRLGIVPYLNVQPLAHGLAEGRPMLTILPATPARLDQMLLAGEIDLGIAPTFSAFSDQQERGILPAPVIASDGAVYSVLLVSQHPIKQWRRIYRDPNSVTSNALTAILIDRCWGGAIEMIDLPEGEDPGPGNLPADCARLLIGDPAMRRRGEFDVVVDLGQVWREWTGLPFVFAAWIGPADLDTGGLGLALEEVYAKNRNHLTEAAEAYPNLRDIPLDLRVKYLSHNLRFEFGDREREAILKFHDESMRLGLAPKNGQVRWLQRP